MKKVVCFIKLHKRRMFVFLLLVLLYGGSFLGSYQYFSQDAAGEQVEDEELTPTTSAFNLSPIPLPEEPNSYAVLFVGYGGAGHSGGGLADSMNVVSVFPEEKKAAFISVPRDLWVRLPDGGGDEEVKLNKAFSVGGGTLAKKSVSAVVGLPIQYFMSVDFGSFRRAIDELGTITVDVPVTFDDYWYPIAGLENDSCGKTVEEIEEIVKNFTGFEGEKQFLCRYEHIHFDGGEAIMNGETALKFVRSRHSEQHGGDFARSQRQFAVLLGVRDKLLTLGAFESKRAFFQRFHDMVQTDIDEGIIEMLSRVVGEVRGYSLVQIQLTEANVLRFSRSFDGQAILVPRDEHGSWEGVHQFVLDELNAGE